MFDSIHEMRNEKLKSENLILLHNTQHMHDQSFNRKLKYKWKKSFRVIEAIVEKRTYLFKKLNNNELNETFVENWIKKFHQRVELSRSEKIKNEMKK